MYTTRFDAVNVSSIPSEFRAEIEMTPVVLGKKNAFAEDEINAIVGVESNVPSSTLLGSLFELLRSGGSHSFLRRLLNEFRTTIPMECNFAQATWSKTKTLVILCQTLYPRVLRRVQSVCKESYFGVLFREDGDSWRCSVRYAVADGKREICVLWESIGSGVCDAEIKCLSLVLALLPPKHVPITLQGCSATLFNAFSVLCKSEGSPDPLFVTEYTPEKIKGHVQDAGLVGASRLDPFAVLEYLMLRLAKAIHQPWLMGLPQFRLCIRQREVPFVSLCAVLEELVQHWADVKLFLEESIVGSVPNGRAPLDMNRVVVTDSLELHRLSLLHVLVACFQANFEKQFVTVVSEYSCRNYAQFCFFYLSRLSKVKKLSELPYIEAWSQHVGRLLNTWSNVPAPECLRSEPIVMSALSGCGDTVKRSCFKERHSFLMEFLKVLNSFAFAKWRVLSSLSCFSPDMLLQGDEAYTVQLFRDLVNCF